MAETPINGAARELLDMPAGRRRTAAAVRALLSLEPQQPATAIPTAEAIAAFQERAQLQPTGEADDTTVRQIVVEVAHQHVVTSRMRTANVQNMLARAGFPPQEEDRSSRVAGDSTIDAVKRFQEVQGLTVDGLVGDKTISALREAARFADAQEIVKHIKDALRIEVHDDWALRQVRSNALNRAEINRTDIAKTLREDHVGRKFRQELFIELIQTSARL